MENRTRRKVGSHRPNTAGRTSGEHATYGDETAFALTHARRHGTPFVLLVDRAGEIHAADRRDGWRELAPPVQTGETQRIPDKLLRLVERHHSPRRSNGEATITLLEQDVVVAVVTMDGPWEFFACSIAQVKREQTMAAAQERYQLTNRELELLERILRGHQSAEIGRDLAISLATVEWHTKRLLMKTFSQNRTQMAARILGWLCDAI
jgi:DNA-binding CsgD family transcriptional regulator